jgi:hypothetical protein
LRSGVQAMVEGRSLPSHLSNRGQARDLTVRLAHSIDPGFDETMIPARTTFAREQAGKASPKGLLNTSLQHVAELSDSLVNLHNSGFNSVDWLPGSGVAANLYNRATNSASKYGEVVNSVNETADRAAGEIGKLYSGKDGGGIAERDATRSRFSHTNTPQQSIGGLEATKKLIEGKLNSLTAQRDQNYGTSGERIFPLIDAATKVAIAKLDANIAKLRKQAGEKEPTTSGWTVEKVQ